MTRHGADAYRHGDRSPIRVGRTKIRSLRFLALVCGAVVGSGFATFATAQGFPLEARDRPNDGGGSVTLSWTSPDSTPTQWMVTRRERGGAFAPLATIEGSVSSFSDDSAASGTWYEYQVVAVPTDPRLASDVSAPVRSAASLFDAPKTNVLVVLLSFFVLLFGYIRLAEGGARWVFRKIAGLAAIEEAIGRATEMGKSVLYVPGVQEIDDMQTIASMVLLRRVATMTAKYETNLMVPTNSPGVYTVAEEVVKSAYADAGRRDDFRSDQVRYITSEQFAYVAAVNGTMLRERPAANLLLGAFFAESLLLAETGHSVGAIQIAGTANVHQMPFFVVACDYTLIGEEYYAASALLSNDNMLLGSLKAADAVKVVLCILIVAGSLLSTFGHTWLGDFFATQ